MFDGEFRTLLFDCFVKHTIVNQHFLKFCSGPEFSVVDVVKSLSIWPTGILKAYFMLPCYKSK